MQYRKDIDGLRAISVVAVVLFHAFPGVVPGGFIGVDVFFVISGYLIASKIIESVGENKFSVIEFYQSRIVRIFPALCLVILSCIVFGYYFILPTTYALLGKHAFFSGIFLQNIALYLESGYFDVSGESKPLLHIWSLGVEEQFYLIIPAIAIIFRKKMNLNGLASLASVMLASMVLNIVLSYNNQSADFYIILTRMWEFLFGAVAAQGATNFGKKTQNFLSVIGISCIISSSLFLNSDIRYPGFWALLPVISSCFVIASPDGYVNRVLLSARVSRYIGKISYPLYLWHWPLLTIPHIVLGANLDNVQLLISVLSSFVAASATLHFVEKPVRLSTKYSMRLRAIILSSIMLTISLAGYFIWMADGLPRRHLLLGQSSGDFVEDVRDPETILGNLALNFNVNDLNVVALRETEWNYTNPHLCKALSGAFIYNNKCVFDDYKSDNSVAVIGDSHAQHLMAGLKRNLFKYGYGVTPYAWPNCHPVIGTDICDNYIIPAINKIEEDKTVKKVIISAFWWRNLSCKNEIKLFKKNGKEISCSELIDMTVDSLSNTIKEMNERGKSVIIVTDFPHFGGTSSLCAQEIYERKDRNYCHASYSKNYKESSDGFYRIINALIDHGARFQVYDLSQVICKDDVCSQEHDGILLSRDDGHLSVFGSIYVTEGLAELVAGRAPAADALMNSQSRTEREHQ